MAVARGCSRRDWGLRCGVNLAEGRWPRRAFAWGLLAGGYSGFAIARGVRLGRGWWELAVGGKPFASPEGWSVLVLEVVRSALGLRLNPGLWGEPGRRLLGVGVCAGCSLGLGVEVWGEPGRGPLAEAGGCAGARSGSPSL